MLPALYSMPGVLSFLLSMSYLSFLCLLHFSSFISVTAIKYSDEKQLSGGFIWLMCPDYSTSSEDVRAGIQADHVQSRAKEGTHTACLLVASCSFLVV